VEAIRRYSNPHTEHLEKSPSEAPVVELSPAEQQANREKYEMFMHGILASGAISAKQQEACTKFRQKHSISDAVHVQVLHSFHLTVNQFDNLQGLEQPVSERQKSDSDTCKICFDNVVNCVILPCGHLAICMDCSNGLRRHSRQCPVCRGPILQAKQVYRS